MHIDHQTSRPDPKPPFDPEALLDLLYSHDGKDELLAMVQDNPERARQVIAAEMGKVSFESGGEHLLQRWSQSLEHKADVFIDSVEPVIAWLSNDLKERQATVLRATSVLKAVAAELQHLVFDPKYLNDARKVWSATLQPVLADAFASLQKIEATIDADLVFALHGLQLIIALGPDSLSRVVEEYRTLAEKPLSNGGIDGKRQLKKAFCLAMQVGAAVDFVTFLDSMSCPGQKAFSSSFGATFTLGAIFDTTLKSNLISGHEKALVAAARNGSTSFARVFSLHCLAKSNNLNLLGPNFGVDAPQKDREFTVQDEQTFATISSDLQSRYTLGAPLIPELIEDARRIADRLHQNWSPSSSSVPEAQLLWLMTTKFPLDVSCHQFLLTVRRVRHESSMLRKAFQSIPELRNEVHDDPREIADQLSTYVFAGDEGIPHSLGVLERHLREVPESEISIDLWSTSDNEFFPPSFSHLASEGYAACCALLTSHALSIALSPGTDTEARSKLFVALKSILKLATWNKSLQESLLRNLDNSILGDADSELDGDFDHDSQKVQLSSRKSYQAGLTIAFDLLITGDVDRGWDRVEKILARSKKNAVGPSIAIELLCGLSPTTSLKRISALAKRDESLWSLSTLLSPACSNPKMCNAAVKLLHSDQKPQRLVGAALFAAAPSSVLSRVAIAPVVLRKVSDGSASPEHLLALAASNDVDVAVSLLGNMRKMSEECLPVALHIARKIVARSQFPKDFVRTPH